MTTTFPFTSPNNLTEISFIAGSNQELAFNVYDSGSVAVNLSGGTVTWRLSQYGPVSTALVSKSGLLSGSPTNQFKVLLLPADTATLGGKYIQQYTLVDSSGSTFIPSQGLVNITRRSA